MLKVYSSSAGSGKTFTLTKEYLTLVLQSEDAMLFRRVLAITFTNDAASEMKSRVLLGLKSIANGEESVLKKALLLGTGLDQETLQNRASKVFDQIIQNYGEFSIKTIDSFVNQIVKAFALDLGVPYNYEITFDEKYLLSEAIGLLLDNIGLPGHEDLGELIVDFANEKIESGKSWKLLPEELIDFGQNILKPEISNKIELNKGITIADAKVFYRKIKKYKEDTFENIYNNAQKALELFSQNGLSAEDFYRKSTGIYGFFEKLAHHPEKYFDTQTVMPNNYVIDTLENDKWYDPKKSTKAAIIDGIKNELKAFAEAILKTNKEKYYLLNQILPNLFKIPLLNKINAEFQDIKKARNEVLLSEFNTKILKVVVNEPVPFIYERIGEKYDHILIDEFQDTSNIQFFNLLPLVDNSLSKSKLSLIVGDPKQSIYRWRGGNINLMMDIMNGHAEKLKSYDFSSENQSEQIDSIVREADVSSLDFNYRSTSNIIDFNNGLFESIIISHQEMYPEVGTVYADYFQNKPQNVTYGGNVDIVYYNKKETSIEEKALELILINLQRGYSMGDITVLCRFNKESSAVAEYLKSKGFEVNSADSLKLASNVAIRFLVSFLEFTHNSDSLFCRFELYHFLQLTLSKDTDAIAYPEDLILNKGDFEKYICNILEINDLQMFLKRDYFFIVQKICSALRLADFSFCRDYILVFQDICLDFYQNKSKSTQDFLKQWKIKKSDYSIDKKSANAITVTSIHKSKGLEYKVVIIPAANWDTKPHKNEELWLDLTNTNLTELSHEGFKLGSAPLKISQGKNMGIAENLFLEQEKLIFVENLNMLYVALTRSIEVLHIGIPRSEKKDESKGVGVFFEKYLKERNQWHEGKNEYCVYDDTIQNFVNKEKTETDKYLIENFPVFEDQLKLKNSALMESGWFGEKILLGNLIHEALENIKTASELDAVLEKYKSKVPDTKIFESQVVSPIRQVLNHPEIAFLFSKEAVVKNESEIFANGSYYRPDRLVLKDGIMYVIDYKTGTQQTAHQKQVNIYCELIRKMGYPKVKGLLIYTQPFQLVHL